MTPPVQCTYGLCLTIKQNPGLDVRTAITFNLVVAVVSPADQMPECVGDHIKVLTNMMLKTPIQARPHTHAHTYIMFDMLE